MPGGTPAARNAAYAESLPPLIRELQASPSLPRPDQPLRVTARIKAGQDNIFNEDIEVLEGQQKNIALNPDMKLRVLSIDSGGAHARKIIERLMADA